jgi:hypothetical protein
VKQLAIVTSTAEECSLDLAADLNGDGRIGVDEFLLWTGSESDLALGMKASADIATCGQRGGESSFAGGAGAGTGAAARVLSQHHLSGAFRRFIRGLIQNTKLYRRVRCQRHARLCQRQCSTSQDEP